MKQLQTRCNQTVLLKHTKRIPNRKQQTIRLFRYRPNTRDILKILSERFYTISRFKRHTKRKINIKEHRFFIQTKKYCRVSQVLDEITLYEDAEIKYPIDETVFASDSRFNEERRLSITMI